MEKSQSKLCMDVLRRLQDSGVLHSMVIVGSWCVYFYKEYFKQSKYVPVIKTRDIDFLVPIPIKSSSKVNIPEILQDLGFIVGFQGREGYVKLEHPELIVEFLVPERGRGSNKPYKIDQLGVNAQQLRYLDFLVDNTITITIEGLHLRLPHPAAYALHKFIIFKRRKKGDKHERDLEGALRVFHALVKRDKHDEIHRIFSALHKKWQKTVIQNLKSVNEGNIVELLQE